MNCKMIYLKINLSRFFLTLIVKTSVKEIKDQSSLDKLQQILILFRILIYCHTLNDEVWAAKLYNFFHKLNCLTNPVAFARVEEITVGITSGSNNDKASV